MVNVKCIQKFRDKQNKIYGYRIVDLSGNTKDVKAEDLKRAILNKQINIINLKLTSDNRLVDIEEKNLASKDIDKSLKEFKKSTRPYDAETYSEFARLIVPLIEKAFDFKGNDKFCVNAESVDSNTGDLLWYNGTMGEFMYEGNNCYIEFDYTYDVEDKLGVIQYNVMIVDGDDSEQYSFKYEFDNSNMKAHFNQILKGTQQFIYDVKNKMNQ